MPSDNKPDLADLRREYGASGLSEADAGTDPFALFHRWFAQFGFDQFPQRLPNRCPGHPEPSWLIWWFGHGPSRRPLPGATPPCVPQREPYESHFRGNWQERLAA